MLVEGNTNPTLDDCCFVFEFKINDDYIYLGDDEIIHVDLFLESLRDAGYNVEKNGKNKATVTIDDKEDLL